MEGKCDAACRVCGDKASGKHYGVASCDGCRGFFKRSIRRGLAYHCKESGCCVVDVTRRNQCQACRFKKCLTVNMKRDAVQHERAPRASLPTTSCLSVPRGRGYAFPSPLPYLGATPLLDLAPYHLVYHQPPHLPLGLGGKTPALGIFGCAGGVHGGAARNSETFQIPNYFQQGRTSPDQLTQASHRGERGEGSGRRDGRGCGGEEEVTSSEEAKELQGEVKESRKQDASTSLTELSLSLDHNVYESAAKLLFLTVKWARSIPSFLQLGFQDQSALLERSWSELFVLSAAQWTLAIDEEYLLGGFCGSSSRQELLQKESRRLRQTLARFSLIGVDHTEFACLKALTLFKSEIAGLRDQSQVEVLQDQTLVMLHDYCAARDVHKARFGKLLLLLPAVNNLSKDLIEELLFRKTIGNISIERVLTDMLKSSSNSV